MKVSVKPKKSLGQNFLQSDRVVSRLVDAVTPSSEDIILEIGPGLGALTGKLLEQAGLVLAIEKDRDLVAILQGEFSEPIKQGKLYLLEQDITEFDPETIRGFKKSHYKIAANIPYNLTGLIIRKFLSAPYQPETMVILIQKEVADRILARDGKESLLSISVKVYGKPKLITNVSRGSFHPVPRVDSAIISIEDISRDRFPNSAFEDLFFRVIHAGFAHKRKVLLKNLFDASLGTRDILQKSIEQIKKPLTVRAEDLSVDDWISITDLLYNHG